MNKPKRLSREVIYKSDWVNVYADKVKFPAGRVIDRHHMIEFANEAVGVIVENSRRELLFVHAYRYTLDTVEWEIVTGGIDTGESIYEAAKREVFEESGYLTHDHRLVYSFNPTNGISDQTFHIVTCRAGSSSSEFDRNEIKETKWFSRNDVGQMINSKNIRDGFTLPAMLLYLGGWVD